MQYSVGIYTDSEVLHFSGPHDVRVRMKAVGICGSDVHYLRVRAPILLIDPWCSPPSQSEHSIKLEYYHLLNELN